MENVTYFLALIPIIGVIIQAANINNYTVCLESENIKLVRYTTFFIIFLFAALLNPLLIIYNLIKVEENITNILSEYIMFFILFIFWDFYRFIKFKKMTTDFLLLNSVYKLILIYLSFKTFNNSTLLIVSILIFIALLVIYNLNIFNKIENLYRKIKEKNYFILYFVLIIYSSFVIGFFIFNSSFTLIYSNIRNADNVIMSPLLLIISLIILIKTAYDIKEIIKIREMTNIGFYLDDTKDIFIIEKNMKDFYVMKLYANINNDILYYLENDMDNIIFVNKNDITKYKIINIKFNLNYFLS